VRLVWVSYARTDVKTQTSLPKQPPRGTDARDSGLVCGDLLHGAVVYGGSRAVRDSLPEPSLHLRVEPAASIIMLTTFASLAVYFASLFVVISVFSISESNAGGSCWSGDLHALDDSVKDAVMEATHDTEANRTDAASDCSDEHSLLF
jgi:hypothetical protein